VELGRAVRHRGGDQRAHRLGGAQRVRHHRRLARWPTAACP
jgi:hypothetical protein